MTKVTSVSPKIIKRLKFKNLYQQEQFTILVKMEFLEQRDIRISMLRIRQQNKY